MSERFMQVDDLPVVRLRPDADLELSLRRRQANVQPAAFRRLVADAGFPEAFRAGGVRLPNMPCGQCGITYITSIDAPAVCVKPGSYPASPTRARCDSCGWEATPAQLGPYLYSDPDEELEAWRKIRCTNPIEHRRTLARYGGKRTLAEHTSAAIRDVLPADHAEGEVMLTLILTPTDQAAKEIMNDDDDDLPEKRVRIMRRVVYSMGPHGTDYARAPTKNAPLATLGITESAR